MNKEKITWGLIFLFIGIILLLSNLNIIHFYWSAVFRFWPVLLIVVGVNMMVPRHGTGSIISVITTVLVLLFLTWQGVNPPPAVSRETRDAATYSYPYDGDIERAYLSIKGGAVDYKIQGYTRELFYAETRSTLGNHVLETKLANKEAHLSFVMKKSNRRWRADMDENRAVIRLNVQPVWHVSLDMGAGAAEFDLSSFRLSRLDLRGGAVSFKAKLGMPQEETVVNADSGVASVEIDIPQAAACRIVAKTGLSSRDFPGFTQQADGSYITDGYERAAEKFLINLKGGLSAFVVKRYE